MVPLLDNNILIFTKMSLFIEQNRFVDYIEPDSRCCYLLTPCLRSLGVQWQVPHLCRIWLPLLDHTIVSPTVMFHQQEKGTLLGGCQGCPRSLPATCAHLLSQVASGVLQVISCERAGSTLPLLDHITMSPTVTFHQQETGTLLEGCQGCLRSLPATCAHLLSQVASGVLQVI